MHEPLSQQLNRILQMDAAAPGLSINQLIERTAGRGFYLLIICLSLPFVVPVSLPGVSGVLGGIIALLCLQLALGLPARLPAFLGSRLLSARWQARVLRGSVRVLRWVERMVKPRRTRWMSLRPAQVFNALLMMGLALLLALPFPPLPPFTNSLPCYALILIAASMMEEDGLLIWVGYAVAAGTVVYLAFIVKALEEAVKRIYQWLALTAPELSHLLIS